MKSGNNPAARLHNILKECKERNKKDGNKPLFVVWRSMFSIPDDKPDWYVLNSLALFARLPYQTLEIARRFTSEELPEDTYLDWKDDLLKACSTISSSALLAHFITPVSDVSLKSLQACAHIFSQRYPEKVIAEKDIAELNQKVTELQAELDASDIPDNLKQYLYDHIFLIQTALDHYPIMGSVGLKDAIDSCLGAGFTSTEIVQQTGKTDVGKRYWEFLSRGAMLIQYSETGIKLLAKASELFIG
jgi:hypothetical protein